jgi:hypothetical protein
VTAAALLALAACNGKKNNKVPEVTPSVDRIKESELPEEGLVLQEIDMDGDGRTDVFNYFRERSAASRLRVKRKADLNLDGQIDAISEFDEEGELERELWDSDFDGSLDWTDHYQGGVRVMAEMDTNYDGRSDIWFYYVKGDDGRPRIDRKERDTNGDGLIDFWERFDAEGNVTRTGRDVDGDGKMDERSE